MINKVLLFLTFALSIFSIAAIKLSPLNDLTVLIYAIMGIGIIIGIGLIILKFIDEMTGGSITKIFGELFT